MRNRVLSAALCAVLLSGCRAETGEGQFEGPPPFMPSYPGEITSLEVFYEGPGCAGAGYVAGYGEEFAYASVRAGPECIEEAGAGYGFQVTP